MPTYSPLRKKEARLIELIASGMTQMQMGRELEVNQDVISKYIKRHKKRLEPRIERKKFEFYETADRIALSSLPRAVNLAAKIMSDPEQSARDRLSAAAFIQKHAAECFNRMKGIAEQAAGLIVQSTGTVNIQQIIRGHLPTPDECDNMSLDELRKLNAEIRERRNRLPFGRSGDNGGNGHEKEAGPEPDGGGADSVPGIGDKESGDGPASD